MPVVVLALILVSPLRSEVAMLLQMLLQILRVAMLLRMLQVAMLLQMLLRMLRSFVLLPKRQMKRSNKSVPATFQKMVSNYIWFDK